MSLTTTDVAELFRLIEASPEFQARLRGFLRDERLDKIDQRLDKIAEGLQHLTARVDALAEGLQHLTARVDALADALQQLTARVDNLAETVERLTTNQQKLREDVGGLLGDNLERRYRERAHSYFGRLLRQVRVLGGQELIDLVEEHLSPDDLDDLLEVDIVIAGQPKDRPDLGEVLVALEVSRVIDRNDVERAHRQAGLLRSSGRTVIPAVGGKSLTRGAKSEDLLVLANGPRAGRKP